MMNLVLLVAVVLNCAVAVCACGGQILGQNFDKYSGDYQTWTKAMAKEDFDGLIFLKFDTYAEVGQGHLRVKNPEGCVGTSDCGATFDVKLDPMDEATLSYRFKHSPGYIYGLGGKLPGLCAMDCPAGCIDVTDSSGFNARVMWRGDEMMSYSYYAGMDPSTNCGENWEWGVSTTSGDWNTVEMYVKINTNGEANGVQTIKYNGAEVLSRSDVLWSKQYHPIEKFTFRSFHGGGSPEWASAQDQYIHFDDITISGGKCSTDAGDTTPEPVAARVSDPVASRLSDPVSDPVADPIPEQTQVTDSIDDDDDTDADNCGTFMAAVCTTGEPCGEGLSASTGDQFLGEAICMYGGDVGGDTGGGDPQPVEIQTTSETQEVATVDDSGDNEEDDSSSGGATSTSLASTQTEPAAIVEEDDEPEMKQDSMGGGSCVPPPPEGFFCTDSGRVREH